MVDTATQVGIIHFSVTDDSSSDPEFVAPAPDVTFEQQVPVTENVVPAPADACTPAVLAGQTRGSRTCCHPCNTSFNDRICDFLSSDRVRGALSSRQMTPMQHLHQ